MKIDRDFVGSIIREIMMKDGPDGHVDGSDIITDFIMVLLEEKVKEDMNITNVFPIEEWLYLYRRKEKNNG